MPEMLFESEYINGKRTAHVFKNHQAKGYAVVCYESTNKIQQWEFETEYEAEEHAEDWVHEK